MVDKELITIEELIKELEKFDKNDKVFLSDPASLYVYSCKTNESTKIKRVVQY
jgi:hypothetical protein